MAVVVAGAESVPAPRVPAIRYLRLGPYDDDERDRIAKQAFHRPGLYFDVLAQLSEGLRELLREPVLLAKFIELVQPGHRKTRLPSDIPTLFRQLLEPSLSSRHASAARRADEVACVLSRLVEEPPPYDLPVIGRALATCGVKESPAEFAQDMRAANIWVGTKSGLHQFSLTVWHDYFTAVGNVKSAAWATPLAITAWVESAGIEELRRLLPFATGFLDAGGLQSALFDALLKRDVAQYARALQTRATTTGSPVDALRSLHRGYLEMVDLLTPKLKPLLEPWSHGDGAEERRGERAVLVGHVSDWDVSFYFGFATKDVPDVVVADEHPLRSARTEHAPAHGLSTHGHTTGADRLRKDSGRLLAAQLLFKQIERILKERSFPLVGWLARERFVTYVIKLGFSSYFEDAPWRTQPVAALVGWAEDELERSPHVDAWGVSGEVIDPARFLALGRQLVADGLGMVALADLGLPGPDLELEGGGYFSRFYSPQRKVRRLTELFRAVAETYPQVCDDLLPGLASNFFRAQFPSRAVVEIDEEGALPTGWTMYWEPTRGEIDPVVSIGASGRRDRDWQALADRVRLACDRLGRPFGEFSAHSTVGEWAPYAEVVTDMVCDLVEHDLSRVSGWLSNAT
jgi:hypothetical protein